MRRNPNLKVFSLPEDTMLSLRECGSVVMPESFEEMPFENGGFGESREFDLKNAEILIEYQGGRVTGSIEDISVGSILSIELDEEDNAVKVLVMSDTNDVFGNMSFDGGKQENGKDAD